MKNPCTMIILWVDLRIANLNLNFQFELQLYRGLFKKLTLDSGSGPKSIGPWLQNTMIGHYFDPKLTTVHIFYATSILCFFVGTAFFPQVFVKCATKIDREGLETTKLFFVTSQVQITFQNKYLSFLDLEVQLHNRPTDMPKCTGTILALYFWCDNLENDAV